MTIARRRPTTFDAIAAPMPPAPVMRLPQPEMRVPVSNGGVPAPDSVTPVGRLRRCVFRRVDRAEASPGRSVSSAYEVTCLYGIGDAPAMLGDIEAARSICEACTARGIFRPDEA